MTEKEFEEQLNWLIEETRAAVAAYDCSKELNDLLRDRNDLQSALMADGAFWQVHFGALQTALFAILGRIFDKGKDSHSISKVLDAAEDHIGFFSLEALAKRKKAGGPEPWWLKDYLKTAWAGERSAIATLKESLKPHIALYRKVYEPLRHTYIAHRASNPAQPIWEMFRQTNREEIGRTIHYLRDVAESLRQAFVDGKNPIPVRLTNEPDREGVRSAVRSVVAKLAEWPFQND